MIKILKNGKPAIGNFIRYYQKHYKNRYLPKTGCITVDKYINYHNNIAKHRYYCEVLVDSKGYVIPAIPSHNEAVFKGNNLKKAKYMYVTPWWEYSQEKICDDFKVIMIWYNYVCVGTQQPTAQQVATIYQLYITKCISYDCWKRFVDSIQIKG